MLALPPAFLASGSTADGLPHPRPFHPFRQPVILHIAILMLPDLRPLRPPIAVCQGQPFGAAPAGALHLPHA